MILLHLSDLHFGAYNRFAGEPPDQLGKAMARTIEAAREKLHCGGRFDIMLVTGDLAETALPEEFAQAELFLAALADHLSLERRKVIFVPGNHDVSWPACKIVRARVQTGEIAEADLPYQIAKEKLSFYRHCLERFYEESPAQFAKELGCDAFLYSYPDLQLSVAAVNSCEGESDLPQDHRGRVSRDQAEAVMKVWLSGTEAQALKIIAVHHNPDKTVRANVEGWRNYLQTQGGLQPDLIARYESDVLGLENAEYLRAIVEDCGVQLILHGHHHAKDEKVWLWRRNGRAHILSAGSITLRADKLPREEPASFRIIELGQRKIRAWSLIYDVRARQTGEVRQGSYVLDPAEDGGYEQTLDLPPGFRFATTSRKPNATGRKAPVTVLGMPRYSWVEELVELVRHGLWTRVQVLPGNGAEEVDLLLRKRFPEDRIIFVDLATLPDAKAVLESIADAADTPLVASDRLRQPNHHQIARAVAGPYKRLVIVLAGWGGHARIHVEQSLTPLAMALQGFKNVSNPRVVLVCISPTPTSHLFASALEGSLLTLTPVFSSANDADLLAEWARSNLSESPQLEVQELIDAAAGQLSAVRAVVRVAGRPQTERLLAIRSAHEKAGLEILGAVGPCCTAVMRGESLAPGCLRALSEAGILEKRDGKHQARIKDWADVWGVVEGAT